MYYLFLIYFRAWLPGSCSPRLALEGHWQNTHRQLDANQWNNEKNVCIHFYKICFTKRYYAWIPLFVRRLPYSCLLHAIMHSFMQLLWRSKFSSTKLQYKWSFNKLYCYLYDLSMSSVFQKEKKQIYRKVALPNFKQYITLYERITYLNLNYYLHWKG